MSIKCKTGTIIAYFMHTKIWNEHIEDNLITRKIEMNLLDFYGIYKINFLLIVTYDHAKVRFIFDVRFSLNFSSNSRLTVFTMI